MTTIKASCPTCGEVALAAGEIALQVDAAGTDSAYTFRCPACYVSVRKPADGRVVRLLVSAGVRVHALDPGDRRGISHPEEPAADLGPLTADDLLEFHEALEGDAWMSELFGGDRA